MIFFGFAIPIAFWQPPGGLVGAGSSAWIVVSAAYMAETLRAGIQAVPKGQTEAARSLGMSAGRTMVSMILPQAFRIVIPPLTNELVLLIKDTSLLFVLGIAVDRARADQRSAARRTQSPRQHHPADRGGVVLPVITLRSPSWWPGSERRSRGHGDR